MKSVVNAKDLEVERDSLRRELDAANEVIEMERGFNQRKIEGLQSRLKEAEEILKPFADAAPAWEPEAQGTATLTYPDNVSFSVRCKNLTVGDFRAAARFLAERGGRSGE